MCVQLLDTEREREIGLGTDYPFEPLGPGECIANAGLGVAEGETLQITVHWHYLIWYMAYDYNVFVKDPSIPDVPTITDVTTTVPCVVKGVMPEPYGKYANDKDSVKQIIMEYN